MPKSDPSVVGLLYSEWTENFKDLDWQVFLSSPFEVNNLLQSLLTKAGQKGAVVIVRATLVGPQTQDYDLPPELAGLGVAEADEEAQEEG